MVKGWRNDPRWVEIYEKRDNARIAREIARIKYAHELEMLKIEERDRAKRLHAGRPTRWEAGYA